MNTIKLFVTGALFLLLHSNGFSAPPPQPQNVQQAWLGTESLLLWDDTPEATSYNVYRSDSTNTTWMLVGSSAVPRFRDPTWQFLPSFYTVTAVNADGESAGSELSTVSFVEQYMIAVYAPQQSDGTVSPTNALVRLATSNVNGGQGLIDWGLDPTNFTWFAINTNYLSYQWFFLTNLAPRTTYFYRLTSITSNRAGVNYLGSFSTLDTNHPPVAENFTAWGPVPTNGGWLGLNGYDSNTPPQSLTFRVISAPTNGTLSDIQPGWGWSGAIIMYTPLPGARGYDYFQFVVNNGTWDSAPGLVTLTNWFNSLPAITNGAFTAVEDTTTPFSIPAVDPEGDPLTFQFYSMNGTIAGTAPNLFFTPQTNFSGQTWLWYQVSDGYATSQGSFTVDVTPVNDKPVIMTNFMPALTTWEDQPLTTMLFVLDNDPLGPNEIVTVTPPAHGTLSGSQWNFIYTPNPNFFGIDQFTIVARELDGTTSDPVTLTVTVQPSEDFPISFGQTVTVFQDTPRLITPTGFDADGESLQFTIVNYATHGLLQGTPTNFIYTPHTNFIGEDSFTFTAADSFGFLYMSVGTIHVQVVSSNGMNHSPDAADFSFATRMQMPFGGGFVVTDVDGDALNCEIVFAPTNGTVTANGTNFIYAPNPGVSFAQDYFRYRVSDGQLNNTGAVWIVIGNTNAGPSAQHQEISVIETRPLSFNLNASDIDLDVLQVIVVSPLQHGTVEFFRTSAYYYADTNFIGTDSFSYRVTDGLATSEVATVTIQVLPNHPPIADPMSLSLPEEYTIDFQLTGSDADGDGLTFVLLTPPAHGSLWVIPTTYPWFSPPGHCQYNGHINYVGSDSFTYAWHDGLTLGAPATVTFNVTPMNDRPVANAQSVTTMEDTAVGITLTASDVDNDPLTFTIVTNVLHGTLSGTAPNLVYTPAANYNGSDRLAFRVSDAFTNSAITTVSIIVLSVNDVPVANAQSLVTAEDTALPITLTGSDVESAVSFSIVSGPTHGVLSGTLPNLTYTPAANYFGNDGFIFSVSDDVTNSTATVSITITPVNDLPPINGLRRRILDGVVQLWWNPVPGTVSYNVYRADEMNGVYTPLASGLSATNYADAAVFYQHNYHYYVTTSDGTEESTPSNPVFARPDDTGVITLYEQLWSIRATTAQVQFCSSLINGVEGLWEYGTTTNYSVVLENTNLLPCPHFTLSNLTPQTVYYYRLTATDSNGNAIVHWNSLFTDGAPIADPQGVSASEDVFTDIILSGHNANYGPYPLTCSIVTPPSHGTLSSLGPNTFRYQPVTNFNGTDSFTFKVNNGELDSAPATVNIAVASVNDTPVTANISVTAAEETVATIPVSFTDVDGGSLIYVEIVSQPAHGVAGVSGADLLYLPATNYFGADSFTYHISDGFGWGNTATVSITVTNVEDSPVAFAQSVTTAEDVNKAITLTGADADGDSITFGIYASPAHGTLTGTPPNVTYRPATNYNGADSFAFRVYDGKSFSSPATVSINVTPVNDRPVANPQSVTVAEDGSISITPTGSDVDPEGLTFVIVTPQAHGSILALGPTTWGYTPAANYNGADSFTFVARDAVTSSAPAIISITVTPVNDAPVAQNNSFTLPEDGGLFAGVTGTDLENDPLTYRVTVTPAHGTLTVTGTSSNGFIYRGFTNYNGPDSFQFVANDGHLDSSPATISLTITPVNDMPSVTNQSVTLAEDTVASITPLAGDVDGDALTFTIFTAPSHGTAVVSGGNLIYTPNTNYNGADSFEYQAHDPSGGVNTATVSLNVQPVNDAPVTPNRTFSVNEDTALTMSLGGSDVDGDGLTPRILSQPTNGVLTGTGPTFVYMPNTNFNGVDHFTYVVNDGTIDGNVGTVTINVNAVDDLPIAIAQTLATDEDVVLNFTLQGDDPDNSFFFTVDSLPAHGGLSGVPPNLHYTPNANFNGTDSFIFGVDDNRGHRTTNMVTLIVRAVNDAPVTSNKSASTPEDTTATIDVAGTDVDGDSLTYSIITPPAHGAATVNGANVIYTPATNYNGSDSFTYRASDGTANGNISTVTITVTAVNDAPMASSQSVTTDEDTAIGITFQAVDLETNSIFYAIVTPPAHGTLTGVNGSRTYTPAANYNGPDSFTFVAYDQWATGDAATVTITVRAVNDAPVANAQSVTTDEDTSAAITLSGSDVDGDALTFTIITGPAHGSLSGAAPNLTYTPAANYNGTDSFSFRVNDGTVNSGAATVSITVLSVNDAPVANAQSVTVTYNTAKAITLTGSDLEDSALTYAIVSGPTNGALSGTAPNITYTPAVGSAGADFFTFRVNDGSSNSAAATVSLTTLNPTSIPSAPSGLNITVPTATGTLILNWNCSATNEDGFKIERSLSSGNGWSEIATTGINIHTFTNTGLTSGTRYYYRVRSYNRLGNSAYSNTVNNKPR